MSELLIMEIFLLPEECKIISVLLKSQLLNVLKQNLGLCAFCQSPYSGWKWLNKLIFLMVFLNSCYIELLCLLIFF